MASKVGLLNEGDGLRVRASFISPSRNLGRITALLPPGSGVTRDNLYVKATTALPAVFPGTPMRLIEVDGRAHKDGAAMLIGLYGTASGAGGGGGFEEVFSMSPNGSRPRETYNLDELVTNNPHNRLFGSTLPKPRIVDQPLNLIRWSSKVYSDVRPAYRGYLNGTHNKNAYQINGYAFDPGTLRFEGMWISHRKYGGIDLWVKSYAATHDRTGWKNMNIVLDTVNAGGETRWRLTEDVPVYHPNDLVTWPTMI